MRGRVLRVLGVLLALGMVASCWLFLPPMLGISGAGEMEIRQAGSDAARGARGMLLLAAPVFAAAPGSAPEGMSFIQEEAGISAWAKVEGRLDLRRAATAFRIVERQTDEYVIGLVLVRDEDVDVFVHRDGWVLAYHAREFPMAKMIDLDNLPTTRLEQAVRAVGAAAGVHVGEVKHYDFRFPDAAKIKVIVGTDSFRLKIPSEFVVFERSFSTGVVGRTIIIDGTRIVGLGRGYGTLTVGHLRPDTFIHIHNARPPDTRRARFVIVLAYREG